MLRLLENMAPKWKDIGGLMGLSEAQLSNIELSRMQRPPDCMKDVAKEWRMRGSEEVGHT